MNTLRELVTLLGFKVDEAGVKKGDAAFNALIKKSETLKVTLDTIARNSAIAFAGVSAGLGLAVKAASDEEAELRRLQTAVEGTGRSWASSKLELLAFAKAQQKQTNYIDDEYYVAMRKIINITRDYTKATSGAALAANIAAKFNIDLETAAAAVGYAYEGSLRKIQMAIPVLAIMETMEGKLETTSKKTAWAIDFLTEQTRGAAAKDMGTYASSIRQVGFSIDDLREAIGYPFLPNLKAFNINISEYLDKLTKYINEHPRLAAVLGSTAWAGTGLLAIVSKVGAAWLGLTITAAITKTSIAALMAPWAGYTLIAGSWALSIGVIVLAVQDLWTALEGGESVFAKLEAAIESFFVKLYEKVFFAVLSQLPSDIAAKMIVKYAQYPEYEAAKRGVLPKPGAPLPGGYQGPSEIPKSWIQMLLDGIDKTSAAPGTWQGPPEPAPAMGGGKAREIFTSRMSGWSESMFATHPVGAAGGGITHIDTVHINVPAGTTEEQVNYIAERISRKTFWQENNKQLKHTDDNFPIR